MLCCVWLRCLGEESTSYDCEGEQWIWTSFLKLWVGNWKPKIISSCKLPSFPGYDGIFSRIFRGHVREVPDRFLEMGLRDSTRHHLDSIRCRHGGEVHWCMQQLDIEGAVSFLGVRTAVHGKVLAQWIQTAAQLSCSLGSWIHDLLDTWLVKLHKTCYWTTFNRLCLCSLTL